MILETVCALISLLMIPFAVRGAVGEYRDWRANRPTPPGTDVVLFYTPEQIAVRDTFTTNSIEVVSPIPAASEELITLTVEATK